jgi:hypothetical protein
MIVSTLDLPILQPAFLARVLVAVTHMPLGMQVLARGSQSLAHGEPAWDDARSRRTSLQLRLPACLALPADPAVTD